MHKTKYLGCDTHVPTVEDIEARIALLRKRRGEEKTGNENKEEKGEAHEERRLGREALDGSKGGSGGSGEGVLEDEDDDDELPPPLPGQEKDKGVAMASNVALPV